MSDNCTCHHPTDEAREQGARTYTNPDCSFHGKNETVPLDNRVANLSPETRKHLEFIRYLHEHGAALRDREPASKEAG